MRGCKLKFFLYFFVFTGLTGLLGALGYSAYRFKNRGSMSTSVYLMVSEIKWKSTFCASYLSFGEDGNVFLKIWRTKVIFLRFC